MPAGRLRVDIDGEPFLLRSAVFQYLRTDPRFDVFLLSPEQEQLSGDVLAHTQGAAPAQPPASVVLTVAADGPLSLRRLREGISQAITYENMQLLAETLFQELSLPPSTSTQKVTGHA